jgi:chromosome segregation ATPase
MKQLEEVESRLQEEIKSLKSSNLAYEKEALKLKSEQEVSHRKLSQASQDL